MPNNRNLIRVVSFVLGAIAIAMIVFALVSDGNNMWLALAGAAVAVGAGALQMFAARGATEPRA